MAPRLKGRKERHPRDRFAGAGYLFPNEVRAILELDRLDYRQLRRLFEIVRPRAAKDRAWTRFSFRDVLALKVAFELAGGHNVATRGGRLRLKAVETACRVLRDRYGVVEPLLTAAMRRDGPRIVAEVHSVAFEPVSGQLQLTTAVTGKLRAHLVGGASTEVRELLAQVRSEVRLAKAPRTRAVPGLHIIVGLEGETDIARVAGAAL